MHYTFRPKISQFPVVPGVFVLRRWNHVHNPYTGWMLSVGSHNWRGMDILNDLREPTAQPFIFQDQLKPGFFFLEFVH